MHVYGRIMQEITERVMADWPVGRPFPVQREMQRITLVVILRAVFGVDDEQRHRMRAAILRFLELADGGGNALIAIRAAQIDLGRLTPWDASCTTGAPWTRRSTPRSPSGAPPGQPPGTTCSRC
jgi:cytochrome P450